MSQPLRPLDFLGRIKVKLGMVILMAVATAFVVNEVGINAGYSRNVRVAVAAVLALILVQLLARGMTKPLREMAAAAQTIAKGRYGLRVTATSRDEVGELARAFNAMAADLGEVDRQRRELVANVSHELRTPITALRAVLENVVDGVSTPDPVTLGTALAQTERLGRLVAQLLDLSRLDSGARPIELEDVELGPLCEQALREAALTRDGVTARCEVPEGLSVRADPDLLAQVLANLLDNAVRHSPERGVVVLAAASEGAGVRLRVADQGPGIPVEDRARAFERFSRLDAGRAADEGGAGLGLAIVKEIVELHGGSIRVEEGAGCRIAVHLPERITMDMTPVSDLAQSSPVPVGPDDFDDSDDPGGAGDLESAESAKDAEASETAGAARDIRDTAPIPVSAAPGSAEPEPVGADLPAPVSEGPTPAGPGAAGPEPYPPFVHEPVLVGAHGRPDPPRNWARALVGAIGGGFVGLFVGVPVGVVVVMLEPLLGVLAGVMMIVIGVFVGTVLGATPSDTPTGWEPAGQPVGTAAGPPHSAVPGPVGAGEATREAAGPQGGDGDESRGDGTGRPGETAGGPPGGYVAPPLFPRPDLPGTPRWVLPACAAVGLLAALALPYSRAGLGFVLVAVAMGVAVLPAVRRRITPWSVGLAVIAYGMVAVAVLRDADWLVALLLLAGFLLAALALSGAGRSWLGIARGGASVVLGLLPVPWFLAAPVKGMSLRRRLVPALVGTGLAVVLVVLFGGLFVSADAVFATAVERVFLAQDWAESMPVRIVLFAGFAVVVASAVLVGLRPVAEPKAPALRLTVGRGLWVTPLVALNLLFAVFVGMQLTVLFGSTRWVVSAAGLTYAEYARSGFFQLVIVSVFVLAIVAVASVVIDLGGRERWLMAALLGLLCALTMVILVSALHRLDLYVDAYGFSRLRASVGAAIWWLGAVFVLVLVAGAVRLTRHDRARWLPRALVMMTGAALLAFAVWNPDLRVAETQVAVRGVDRLDQAYLGVLGAEAVPALDRLPEPMRSCVLRDVVGVNHLYTSDPWNGWNLAREQARELLRRHPVLAKPRCPADSSYRLGILDEY